MSINPKMWDDRHFVCLSDQGKLLWCYLLTGNRDGVPGLIRGGPGTFTDAMRWTFEVTSDALDQLIKVGFVEYDLDAHLLRVPGLPKYRGCGNGNVLKGWLRRWHDVPESPLKYRHIESVRDAAVGKKFYEDAWAETFGPIKVPEPSKQVPLFLIESTSVKGALNNNGLNSSRNGSETVRGMNITATETETERDTETETADDIEPPGRPRVADPIERHVFATELWALQEELRLELSPDAKARENPTRQDLRPIMVALESYSKDELENSLRVNAATSSNNPDKAQYFNGYNNWHPESLRRTVGQIVPASSGRHGVRGRKKFKGGRVI